MSKATTTTEQWEIDEKQFQELEDVIGDFLYEAAENDNDLHLLEFMPAIRDLASIITVAQLGGKILVNVGYFSNPSFISDIQNCVRKYGFNVHPQSIKELSSKISNIFKSKKI